MWSDWVISHTWVNVSSGTGPCGYSGTRSRQTIVCVSVCWCRPQYMMKKGFYQAASCLCIVSITWSHSYRLSDTVFKLKVRYLRLAFDHWQLTFVSICGWFHVSVLQVLLVYIVLYWSVIVVWFVRHASCLCIYILIYFYAYLYVVYV